MRNRKLAVAVASGFAGLALFASGCSSASDGGKESSPSGDSGDSAAAGGGSGANDSTADAVDKDQKLRKCLREKGVKIADLPPGTDPRSQTLAPPEGTPPEKWQKALEGCGASPQGGGGSDDGASEQQAMDQQLKMNKCLRGKGFDMPDPKPAKGGVSEGFRVPQGADPEKFMKALNECAA